jgi:hypothetical protein
VYGWRASGKMSPPDERSTLMRFTVTGLDPTPFIPLFGRTAEELAALGARRMEVDRKHAFPDRIELRDGRPGERMLLVNHVFLDAPTAYRGSHAIFVREGADRAAIVDDEIPAVMQRRMLSLRAFDREHWMLDAALIEGSQAKAVVQRLLADTHVAYLHAHYAVRGCFAARIERA